MFSYGSQCKSRDVNLDSRNVKPKPSSSSQLLLAHLNEKLNSGLKDKAKSLGRFFSARTQTSSSINVRSDNYNCYNSVSEQPKRKSKIDRSPSSGLKKNNCTALNDKILGEPRFKRAPSVASVRLPKSRNSSIEGQANWVPSIKSSLQRSLSLQPSKHLDKDTCRSNCRKDQHNHHLVDHTKRQCSSGSELLMSNSRRMRNAISYRVNKCDSWLSTNNKVSFATVFVLFSILLPLSNYAAPIPPEARIQPIWLHDGLITLDSNLVDSEEPQPQPTNTFDYERLNQILADIGIRANIEDADQVNLGRNGEVWPQDANSKSYELYPELNLNLDALKTGDDDLLAVQRRRLERDRALEPPPWLREQPMRRGYNPTLENESNSETNEERKLEALPEDIDEQSKLRGNRQSRELANQLYDEFLKTILEGALDNHKIVDDLYEVLQQKTRTYRPSKSSAPIPNANVPLGEDESVQRSSQQRLLQTSQSEPREPLILSQESEPDSTLIIVGDEVSSEDDVPTGNASKNGPMSAAYTLQSNANAYRNVEQNNAYDKSTNTNPSLAAVKVNTDGQSGASRPKTYGSLSGIDLLSVDPIDQQSGLERNANVFPLANSFHVVEDIDKDDGSQDTTIPSGSTLAQDFVSSSQQFVEPSEWLNIRSEADKPLLSSNPMKRSASAQPDQQIQHWLKSQTENPEKLSEIAVFADDNQNSKSIQNLRLDSRDQLAVMLIESGYISQDQLIEAATKLKTYLEELINIPIGSILGIYPLNGNQLLVRLDTNKLDSTQMLNMIKNYDFARGFILVNWPNGSQRSPLPLLAAISRVLVVMALQCGRHLNIDDERTV